MPAALLVAVLVSPVAVFVMVMVASGTTAPDGSVTVPFSSAFSCAEANATHRKVRSTAPAARLMTFICPPKNGPANDGDRVFLEAGGKGTMEVTLYRSRESSFARAPTHRRKAATRSCGRDLPLEP